MTKRDYIKLAARLSDEYARAEAEWHGGIEENPTTYIARIVEAVADVLEADNEAFDRDKFVKAAKRGAIL
jgi:hypothetical protein